MRESRKTKATGIKINSVFCYHYLWFHTILVAILCDNVLVSIFVHSAAPQIPDSITLLLGCMNSCSRDVFNRIYTRHYTKEENSTSTTITFINYINYNLILVLHWIVNWIRVILLQKMQIYYMLYLHSIRRKRKYLTTEATK